MAQTSPSNPYAGRIKDDKMAEHLYGMQLLQDSEEELPTPNPYFEQKWGKALGHPSGMATIATDPQPEDLDPEQEYDESTLRRAIAGMKPSDVLQAPVGTRVGPQNVGPYKDANLYEDSGVVWDRNKKPEPENNPDAVAVGGPEENERIIKESKIREFVGPPSFLKMPNAEAPVPGPAADQAPPRVAEKEGNRFNQKEMTAAIEKYLNAPTGAKVDLSPLIAYVDSQTGSRLMPGYKRPQTREDIIKQRRELAIKMAQITQKADADNERNKVAKYRAKVVEDLNKWKMAQPPKDDFPTQMAKLQFQAEAAKSLQDQRHGGQMEIEGGRTSRALGEAALKDEPGDKGDKEQAITDGEIDGLVGNAFYSRLGKQPNKYDKNHQAFMAKMDADIRSIKNTSKTPRKDIDAYIKEQQAAYNAAVERAKTKKAQQPVAPANDSGGITGLLKGLFNQAPDMQLKPDPK